MRKKLLCTALALALFVPGMAAADNDARDYILAPDGTFLMITYLRHFALKDADVQGNVQIFRPVYYLNWFGPIHGGAQALIITGDTHVGAGAAGDFGASGFYDPIINPEFTWYQNPAAKFWLGSTFFLTIPIGTYDKNQAVNLGANRWAFRPELNVTKGFDLNGHNLYLEVAGSVEWFGDNDEAINPVTGREVTLERDYLYYAEAHISYDITPAWYVSADYYYQTGGESELGGVDLGDDITTHAYQGTIGFGIAESYQLLLQWKNVFSAENTDESTTFGARFLYAF